MGTGWYERFRRIDRAAPTATDSRFACPCCGCLTIGELGDYELCPVCSWEDDPHQSADATFTCGANGYSLESARRSYKAIGASDPTIRRMVRKPGQAELPR